LGVAVVFARAFIGSSEVMNVRGFFASVNFVTCYDGFTLEDLVTYTKKNNWANGENNADGTSEDHSWNCGAEGPSNNPVVQDLRFRSKRSLIATLLFSLGVPMLSAGDELGRTQGGNNNAYCQDNETSWLDWRIGEDDRVFLRFVERVALLRRQHPVFRRASFYRGQREGPRGLKDIVWFMPDGSEMSAWHWEDPQTKAFGCAFGGTNAQSPSRYVFAYNAGSEPVPFLLPEAQGGRWRRLLDTAEPDGGADIAADSGAVWPLAPHALVLFEE